MDVNEKKHKKRKHGESSVLGGEDVQLDDGSRKKKSKSKIEGLSGNIGGEGSDGNRYRKEKKREKRRLRVEEANNGDKVGGEAEKGSVVEGSDRKRMNGNEGGDVMNPEVGAVIEELKDKKKKKKSKSKPEIEGLSGNAGANVSEDKSRKEKKREKRRLRADEANNGDKVGGKVEKGSVVEGSDGNSTNGNESGGVMNPEVGTVIEEVNDKKEKKKKSKSKPEVEGLSGNGVSEVVVNGEASVSEKIEHEEGQKKKKKKKEKDSVEGLRGDGATEVFPVEKAIMSDKVEHDQGQKKKKKKKEKDSAGALLGNGASEVVLDGEVSMNEKVEHEEGQKKKKKKKEKDSAEGMRGNGVSEVVLDGGASVRENVEHEEGQKKKRKKEKDSAVVGHVKDVESVKDKKRTKKKEPATHLASDNDREGKRDGASKKRQKKLLANNTEENANAGVSVNNQSNEPTEFAKQSNPSKKQRKVKFADTVEVFPLPDNSTEGEENLQDEGQTSEGEENLEDSNEKKNSDDGLVRGKRFSKEEDEMVRNAVLQYIEDHKLGEEGVNMVMKCSKHKETKECWKEIAEALPWRTRMSIYSRAHILFERGESSTWSKEELEMVRQYHEKHGPKWRELADEMGRNRIHVKDAFRQVKLANKKTGHWSQEEYQNLFNLVNKDLRIRAFMDRKSKHGMLRDNIGWEAISDQLTTRTDPVCCVKWYDQLTSALVASGEWADSDDYRLLMALDEIDATCEEEVDWDFILEHRSGDMCRKRWYEMVRHIGKHGNKSFSEQVEILSQRYCPDVLEARETYDSKPFVDK